MRGYDGFFSTELDAASSCVKSDPRRALSICQNYLSTHPDDPLGLFYRSQAWERLGELQKALADHDRMVELDPDSHTYSMRGQLRHGMNDYAGAVADLTRARELDDYEWRTSFGPHFRADLLARLGRLEEALADCALIAEDHWMPGVFGLPSGDKAEFIAEVKRRALAAQQRRR